jgi:hypothetical protein
MARACHGAGSRTRPPTAPSLVSGRACADAVCFHRRYQRRALPADVAERHVARVDRVPYDGGVLARIERGESGRHLFGQIGLQISDTRPVLDLSRELRNDPERQERSEQAEDNFFHGSRGPEPLLQRLDCLFRSTVADVRVFARPPSRPSRTRGRGGGPALAQELSVALAFLLSP